MKLGCDIVRAADLHPIATTIHDEMEEEVKAASVTSGNTLQRCEDLNLNVVYKKEDEFSKIPITLVRDQTAGYNSDNNVIEGNNQPELHAMTMDDLE